MEDSRRLLHPAGSHGESDHHCHDHAHFTAGCERCQRARDAFLPYRNVDPHAKEHAAGAPQSFGLNDTFSSAAIVALTSHGNYFRDDSDYQIAEGITDGIIGDLSKI
jgi:hypothetical protein